MRCHKVLLPPPRPADIPPLLCRNAKELSASLVSKCLKGRASAVKLAGDMALMLAELEQGDIVVEARAPGGDERVHCPALLTYPTPALPF